MVRLFLSVSIGYSWRMHSPELSIIVPVYNEHDQLEPFFEMLAAQQSVRFELLLCDGGSNDGTRDRAHALAQQVGFPVKILGGDKGRARQANTGAAAATAEILLFLHVDSRFADPLAFGNALLQLQTARTSSQHEWAGHFSLSFRIHKESDPAVYYHLENKARLNRPECTHGDQGFMLSKAFFRHLGQFETDVPLAEDTRLAERVRREGAWMLFPERLSTSARRFEVEGMAQRQTLNAIMMNFLSFGWDEFFTNAPHVYATQDRAQKLDLLPYLQLVGALTKPYSLGRRLRFWYSTGTYVCANAWQIPFYFDSRYQYRAGLPPGTGPNRRLTLHDTWIKPLIDHPPGRAVSALLTWCWYRITRLRLSYSA